MSNIPYTPMVSVILPAYNAGDYLTLAIKSIIQQTFTNWELLLIDDGSTDSSIQYIRDNIHDKRIKIISDGKNRGLSVRLNQGINLANGKYIARMDADDIAFPERFLLQLNFLEENPEIDLIGCRALVFSSSGNIIGLLPFAQSHHAICASPWRNIPIPHPTWLGKTSWFRKHLYAFPEVKRAEDQELLLRSSSTSQFACLPDILIAYRQGDFNLKRTLTARRTLLAAQIKYFMSQNRWDHMLMAIIVSSFKMAVDLVASVPGAKYLYFFRMAEPAPDYAKAMFNSLLNIKSAHAKE